MLAETKLNSMRTFALLWGKILQSSLWVKGSKDVRLVWIAMLAMKDGDGIVRSSLVGLADRAKVSEKECEEALRVLMSPDPYDTSKVEEGRRVREVPGGWQIINNDLYKYGTEQKRAYWRAMKEKQRQKEREQKRLLEQAQAAAAVQQVNNDLDLAAIHEQRNREHLERVRGERLAANPFMVGVEGNGEGAPE